MAGFILVGGGFQDSAGLPLAFGRMTAHLSQSSYPTFTPSQVVCNGFTCGYPLDSNGDVSTNPPQFVWPNNILTDIWNGLPDTYYMLTVYSHTGLRAWGPNAIVVTSSGTVGFSTIQVSFAGGTSTYTIPSTPVTNSLTAYVNGMEQPTATVSGTTVSLGWTPASGDVVAFTYYRPVGGLFPMMVQQVPTGTGTALALSTIPLSGTVMLFRNGLLQREGVDYTITNMNITLTLTLGGDTIYAIFQTAGSEILTASFQQVPSGTVDGVNTIFTLGSPTVAGNVEVFNNGLYLLGGGVDYTIASDGFTLTFTTAPGIGDSLIFSDILNLIDVGTFVPQNPA